MPSSESFAVWLPLFLLGTLAIVVVFFPMGCGAPNLNAIAPAAATNNAAPSVGAASFGTNPLLHKTASGRLVGLPSASVNFPNADNPAPLVHSGSRKHLSHVLPVQALPADNASGFDNGDEAGKSHDTSHLIGFGLEHVGPHGLVLVQKEKNDGSSDTAKTNEEKIMQEGTNNEDAVLSKSESTGKRHHSLDPVANARELLINYDSLLKQYEEVLSEQEKPHKKNDLIEKKSHLATALFAVMKIGHQGTGNPQTQVQQQIRMIGEANRRLDAHPDVGFDVVSNDIKNNPVLGAKFALKMRLNRLLAGLMGVAEIFSNVNGGQHLTDRYPENKLERDEVAMKAMEQIKQHHHKGPEPSVAQGAEAEIMDADDTAVAAAVEKKQKGGKVTGQGEGGGAGPPPHHQQKHHQG